MKILASLLIVIVSVAIPRLFIKSKGRTKYEVLNYGITFILIGVFIYLGHHFFELPIISKNYGVVTEVHYLDRDGIISVTKFMSTIGVLLTGASLFISETVITEQVRKKWNNT